MTTTGPTITFRQAAENDACQEGMDAMARRMGYPDGYHAGLADVEVPIADVLTARGLYDALICLEWVGEDRSLRLFAADCAERVVHLTGPDPRCVQAIHVARLYAYGLASTEELRAAGDFARVATGAAPSAAAWAVARAAARDAAGAASWAAIAAAARDAAGDFTWAAARAAEQQWQAAQLRKYLV